MTLHGDEWLRQELRKVRRHMDEKKLEGFLKEHEEAIAAMIAKGEQMNAALNDIGRDIARRQGAITQLKVLLGRDA